MPHGSFAPVTREILAHLVAIVGTENVLVDAAQLRAHGFDAGTRKDLPVPPAAVVRPSDADQIASILKLANRELIPVTPRAGGTGLAGAAVPVPGGIVLDLSRLDKILRIDEKARYALVQPGVRTVDLQRAARERGLLYAGDPCSNDACMVGGNIGTNAGGNKAVKYGVTSDQVLELEIVTPLGERTTLGGRLRKNSTGYNLVRLFSGSEGTLGVVVGATVRLHRLAPLWPDFQVVMPDLVSTMELIDELRDDPRLDPTTLEVIDRRTVLAMEHLRGDALFNTPAGDVLLVQFEAYDEEEVEAKGRRIADAASRAGSISVTRVSDSEAVWEARRGWGKALEEESKVSAGEDLVLPVDELKRFVALFQELVSRYGFDFRLAGHAGDGNMHIRVVPGTASLETWPLEHSRFRKELYALAYALGGRLSGEHGIGLKRKDAFLEVVDPVELSLMRSVKLALDPNGILNPGKIFDPA